MDSVLQIDDQSYSDAAISVGRELQSYGIALDQSDVEKILRRYVLNGTTSTQHDYGDATGYEKDQMSRSIADDLGYSYSDVANTLNTLTTQGLMGLADERIAFPHKWELIAEDAKRQETADTAAKEAAKPSVINQGIYDFSNAISSGLLRGLEGAFPLVIIGIALYVISQPRRDYGQ